MPYTKYDYPKLPFAIFDDKHSYKDYGLLLRDYDVGVPQRITTSIKTAGGTVDVTEYVNPTPLYERRTIDMTFAIPKVEKANFYTIYKAFFDAIQGKVVDVEIYDRPCVYTGRASINTFKSNVRNGIIAVSIDAEPIVSYKESRSVTLTFSSTVTTNTVVLDIEKYTYSGDTVTIAPSRNCYIKPILSTTEEFPEESYSANTPKTYTFTNSPYSDNRNRKLEIRPRSWTSGSMTLSIVCRRKGGVE